MIKCPKCHAEEGIKWFLRNTPREGEKENLANTITLLCTNCRYNESFFLEECLEELFPDWDTYNQEPHSTNISSFLTNMFNFSNSENMYDIKSEE